jgi:hypothetical protein
MEIRNITEIKPNPKNPRVIRDDSFKKLVESVRDFPEMLEKRALVCYTDTDGKLVVLGGNQRLKALKEIGAKQAPVILADDWTAEQKEKFILYDNADVADWNWSELSEWQKEELADWGEVETGFVVVDQTEVGDIVELDKITTTFNINIKCDSPDELEAMKFKLGITSNSIHSTMLLGLLA